jgi:hypothetical protein
MCFYGIFVSVSLNNGPLPLQLGLFNVRCSITRARVRSYYRECDVRLEDIAATKSQAISRVVKADIGTSRSHYSLECWGSGQ